MYYIKCDWNFWLDYFLEVLNRYDKIRVYNLNFLSQKLGTLSMPKKYREEAILARERWTAQFGHTWLIDY